ncbi:S9 family peptidase [Amycolatopsis sp. NPDC026612]|uniref:S9 family peptidase n=1 Tax=Amycolatopsis sp. NPDC026612 TaxID=3155466 RepID=UPI0033DE8D75
MLDVPLVPRRILFGEPAVAAPSLAPSGEHLAYLALDGADPAVWFGALSTRDFRPLAELTGGHVEDYAWARDGRHLLYQADCDGDENDHLMAVDLLDGHTTDLTPFPGVRARVAGLQSAVPDQVLVEMNLADRGRNDLYRLDLGTGAHQRIPVDAGLGGWVTDGDLTVRAAQRRTGDGGSTILARDDEETPWRELLTLSYEDSTATQVLGFTTDGTGLLVLSPVDAETTRLLRLDARTGAVRVLYQDDTHDVTGVWRHPRRDEIDLVVVEGTRSRLIGLTEQARTDVRRVCATGRGDVTPLGRDRWDRRWLVQDNVADGPAAYRLFDRRTGRTEELFTHQPALEWFRLAGVEPFRFTTRDGLTVHGYLTFPPGARCGLPAVLNVHGGPWERNRWGFRAESQWLANRGYLSIEVNYRGSTGYGRAFELAGDREWGGRMQDDLVDAVRWVVERGYADPARLAVYGVSYGGYAALAGAAFTPDLFRCAVAVAAPVNLGTFVGSVPDYWPHVRARMARRVGDPDLDAEFLWSRSPLSRAADIRVPLLLAHGGNDPRVPVGEAAQLVDALRANGIEHEYLCYPDEGHGFHRPANVLGFHAAAERFLARHLGGRCEPEEG